MNDYPVSCASCALMIESKLFRFKNAHTAGYLLMMIRIQSLSLIHRDKKYGK